MMTISRDGSRRRAVAAAFDPAATPPMMTMRFIAAASGAP